MNKHYRKASNLVLRYADCHRAKHLASGKAQAETRKSDLNIAEVGRKSSTKTNHSLRWKRVCMCVETRIILSAFRWRLNMLDINLLHHIDDQPAFRPFCVLAPTTEYPEVGLSRCFPLFNSHQTGLVLFVAAACRTLTHIGYISTFKVSIHVLSASLVSVPLYSFFLLFFFKYLLLLL
ncbi:hypothetical protein BGX38DRAFT_454907 [Terfezia claveryi]|nr:hypothetical protein BGX38DRAFT_454907 [Terfezia claveryi]